MAKENAKEFLMKLSDNKEALELLNGREKPKDADEIASLYAEIAGKLGEKATAEDFKEALAEIEKEMVEKAKSVSADIEALDDTQLDDVAGGIGNYYLCHFFCNTNVFGRGCEYDFENDDCWVKDACEIAYVNYWGCDKTYHETRCGHGAD